MPPQAQGAARPVQPPGPRIAVIGAGVSGILAAIKLKAQGPERLRQVRQLAA